MSEYGKEYIELRLILIGEKNVGKKSFINRLLKVPSTSTIHDTEKENLYKMQILKLRKRYEKKKNYLNSLKEINDEMAKIDKKNKVKDDKERSTTSNIINNKFSKISEKNITFKDNDYMMQVTSEELHFSKDYIRPPIPEHPSKLFNVHKTKICVKPFFILPPEKVSYDYFPAEEDSEYEIDNHFNFSFKGLKNDIKKIINNKKTIIEELPGYKISLYNIFAFIYDMSKFNSFEMLIHYYDLIEVNFNLSKIYDLIPCIIGNKRDQKIFLYSEMQNTFNDFIKEHNLPIFEISTKPYFKFDKFFLEFLIKFLNKYHVNLFKEYNFKKDFEKILINKPSFSKSNRENYSKKDLYPGPSYDVNIYSFNSFKEIFQSLNNNKYRFNRKIFYNKIGPKFHNSKSTKDINNVDILNINLNSFLSQEKGGLLNKPIEGHTFGIVKGKLNLFKSRKELIFKRYESLKESIKDDMSLLINNLSNNKKKGEEYIEETTERRKKLFEIKKNERKKILEKIFEIHSNNFGKIKNHQEQKKKKIILSQNNKSLSYPNLFATNNAFMPSTKETKEKSKKRFLEVVYPKNKNNLEEYKKILKKINKNKQKYETPSPNKYDIRNNYKYNNKGPSITGKRKEMILYRVDPSFPNLKDEFDLIVEKGTHNYTNEFKPRFKEIKKEKKYTPYPDEKIWKKWERNKSTNEKKGKIKIFIQYLRQKKRQQIKKAKEIKAQKDEIQKLRQEILIRKGYENLNGTESINYSLIEESSPKYSIKGRHSSLFSLNDENDISNIFPGNTEMMEIIKNSELNTPIPNTNIIKSRLPSFIFNKAKRFDDKTKEYERSSDLFKDGVFGLKTHENFSNKQPYSYTDKRDSIYQKKRKSPSPAEYKIKSSFEIISEKGKKISEIRDKIRTKKYFKNSKIRKRENNIKLDLQDTNKNEENSMNYNDN